MLKIEEMNFEQVKFILDMSMDLQHSAIKYAIIAMKKDDDFNKEWFAELIKLAHEYSKVNDKCIARIHQLNDQLYKQIRG